MNMSKCLTIKYFTMSEYYSLKEDSCNDVTGTDPDTGTLTKKNEFVATFSAR